MSKNLIGEAFNRWLVINFGEKTFENKYSRK